MRSSGIKFKGLNQKKKSEDKLLGVTTTLSNKNISCRSDEEQFSSFQKTKDVKIQTSLSYLNFQNNKSKIANLFLKESDIDLSNEEMLFDFFTILRSFKIN